MQKIHSGCIIKRILVILKSEGRFDSRKFLKPTADFYISNSYPGKHGLPKTQNFLHPLLVFHLVLHNLAIFLHIHHRKDMPLELQEYYIHLAHVPSKLHLRSVPALLMHGIALRHIPDNTYFHFLVLVHLLIPSYFLYHKEQLPVQWFSFLWFLVSFLTLPRLLLLL